MISCKEGISSHFISTQYFICKQNYSPIHVLRYEHVETIELLYHNHVLMFAVTLKLKF